MAEEVGARCRTACLRVSQNRAHHGTQIAAYALAVVSEDGRNALDIGWARIAGHQMLDQLPTDERTDVRMSENVVERIGQILLGTLTGRYRDTVQQCLITRLVMIGKGHH